jgi:hypothetical protein
MAYSRICRFALLAACMGAAAGISGCHAPPSEVSGTITMNGKAPKLKGLEISFLAVNGQFFSAPINADGTYKCALVPAGEAQVSFVYMPGMGGAIQEKPRLVRPEKDKAQPKGSGATDAKNPIPKYLRDASTSHVTVNILGGQPNVFDYDIKPRPDEGLLP